MASRNPESVRRRHVLTVALGGIVSLVSAALAVPLIGYIFAPYARQRPEAWVRVCSLSEVNSYTPKEFRVVFPRTDAPMAYEDIRGVFVVRRGQEILTFSNVCTHMQCSVRWLDWRQHILCPCHAGTYDRWGLLAGGPPGQSLPLYVNRIEGEAVYITDQMITRPALQPAF